MYRNILVATDGSELASRAVEHGVHLAQGLGAKITAVTVTDMIPMRSGLLMPQPSDVDRYESSASKTAASILAKVDDAGRAKGVACDLVHVADRSPAEGILETCTAKGCDLIVMATHGYRGYNRFLLGSHAQQVMTSAKVPVLIIR